MLFCIGVSQQRKRRGLTRTMTLRARSKHDGSDVAIKRDLPSLARRIRMGYGTGGERSAERNEQNKSEHRAMAGSQSRSEM
jgi:hypothetical protein